MSAGPQLAAGSLAGLKDASAIREQLDRIQRAIADDPALAVGSAKELIESTAKVVLAERGLTVSDKADLPELVRQAQQALGLHPSSAVPGPDSTEAVRRILGGVSTIAAGLAELRNRGYGTGHGTAASAGRPTAPPRSPRSQRRLHLVPADARHPRRPRSAVAPRTQELTHPPRQPVILPGCSERRLRRQARTTVNTVGGRSGCDVGQAGRHADRSMCTEFFRLCAPC